MSKYGRIERGAPDVSQDIAALKDLLTKGEIDRSEYNKKLSLLLAQRMSFIVQTNGRFEPGKRVQKKFDRVVESLRERKEKGEILKQMENRNEFIEQVQKAAEVETPTEQQ